MQLLLCSPNKEAVSLPSALQPQLLLLLPAQRHQMPYLHHLCHLAVTLQHSLQHRNTVIAAAAAVGCLLVWLLLLKLREITLGQVSHQSTLCAAATEPAGATVKLRIDSNTGMGSSSSSC
jgi:hypothetical protein